MDKLRGSEIARRTLGHPSLRNYEEIRFFFFSLRVSLRDTAEPKRDPRWFLSRSRPESSPTTVPFNFPLDASTIRNDFVTRNCAPRRDEKRSVDELSSVVDSILRNLPSPRHLLNASSDRSVESLDEITGDARYSSSDTFSGIGLSTNDRSRAIRDANARGAERDAGRN